MRIDIPLDSIAVPCFVGFTERMPDGGQPRRIASLHEYQQWFGGPPADGRMVELQVDAAQPSGYRAVRQGPAATVARFQLYWAVRLYFDNGGRDAVVVPCGTYAQTPTGAALLEGLAAVRDNYGTLLVVPDASVLASVDDYAAVTRAMLANCAAASNRFALLDVWQGHQGPEAHVTPAPGESPSPSQTVIDASRAAVGASNLEHGAAYYPFLRVSAPPPSPSAIVVTMTGAPDTTLDALTLGNPRPADAVRSVLVDLEVLVAPSGAIAGVYAQTDMNRGVWKAPANVSVNDVVGPAVPMTDVDQAPLNVDPVEGKSINVIRLFTGKGTLVWGARTLAGNDNEWRYVPVRRLLSLLGVQLRRATTFVVFEPQGSELWQRARDAAETVLTRWWRDGALQGATPKDAYFVRCGLGTTMTQQDVDAGRVIIEVGLAPVRPGEFIIVRVSHVTGQ